MSSREEEKERRRQERLERETREKSRVEKLSPMEEKRFEEVLHRIPLTLTIMDMDPDHARAMARVICKEIFQSLIDQGRESGEFRNVMWEPIKIEVDTGEEKDV